MSINPEADKAETERAAILNRPLLPLLVQTALPTIIGMLVTVMYNMTDTFFIGMLNDRAMTAAIGVVYSFMSLLQALGFWFGYGSGNIMSRKIGEGDSGEAACIASLGLRLSVAAGLIVSALSAIFVRRLAGLIGGGASPRLLELTVEYLSIIIVSAPFCLYSLTLYNQLRLCGRVKDAAAGLLLGMLSNMLLDAVLMFGLRLGFAGAAFATLAGQIIGSIALTLLAERSQKPLVLLSPARLSGERLYHILAGGMPNFSRQALTSLALILLNTVASSCGESLLAALTVSARILALAYFIMIGWGQGFQPICAMNYGAARYDRVKKAFALTVTVASLFLLVSALLLYVCSEPLLRLMSTDEEVLCTAGKILRMQCVTLPLLGYFAIGSMLMQNIGQYFCASIIAVSRQGLFYIPLLYLLSGSFGEFGIYLLQPAADVLSFILSLVLVCKIGFKAIKQCA